MFVDTLLCHTMACIKQWSERQLTPIACITVIKTLILPKLVHLFTTLSNPGDKILKQINDILFQFVWQGPIGKIKKQVYKWWLKNDQPDCFY